MITATVIPLTGMASVRALCAAQALEMWAKHKMLSTRTATPTRMMRLAAEITGKTFKRHDYLGAAAALRAAIA